jgi:hypothetical protein
MEAENDEPGRSAATLGMVCDGHYHWYWAWGSYCGVGIPNGTYAGVGPVPIRLGGTLSSPPPTDDIYVIRHLVAGQETYEGYVNGSLLTGTDANGNVESASVPAWMLCWDANSSTRAVLWFGETFNHGDSMGGWTGSTRNHLDYTTIRDTVNHGWVSPSPAFVSGQPCVADTSPNYSCTQSGTDRFYIDSNQ